MKKVLMVAYQFPPAGGSGVQRSAKFAKYLPQYGWEPVILTREAGRIKLRDDTLLKEIPYDMEIIRTPSWDLTASPGPLAKIGKFIAWKVLIPDGEVLWMKRAWKTLVERLGRGDIRALYTTSYPYSDHLMGLKAKRVYPDLPWVADFRDEWTNNPYLLDKPHPMWRAKRERLMERQVLERADHLIANTPVMKRNFARMNPDLDIKQRMSVIPNGFDEEDFVQNRKEGPVSQRFTVTYTGSLYGRRTPQLFLRAVGNLVGSGRIPKKTILIRFIGNIKEQSIKKLVSQNGLDGVVELVPYMNHRDCIGSMLESHVLLLLEGGKGSEAFYTGKLFEYIRAGRPILALVPSKGAAADLIKRTRTGIVCDWWDVISIERGLAELHDQWAGGSLILNPDHEEIRRYDREALTGVLAGIMDGLTKD